VPATAMLRADALKRLDALVGRPLVKCLPRPGVPAVPAVSRLLFIRPGGIGDAVLLVPAIRALRQAVPGCVVEVLAERRNAGVFPLCPEVARTWCYDRPGELLTVLRRRYDVVIDSEQWYRLSALVARLVRAPVKIGYATNERTRLFTHPVGYSHDDYEALSFGRLLEPLGVAQTIASAPYLVVPSAVRERVAALLGPLGRRPFVAIFPGASIPERRWGAEKFCRVAAALARHGTPVVVVGGSEDVPVAEVVAAAGSGLSLAGRTTLAETASVIERAATVVSGDSGVLHLAVGLGRPTVSLFGPGIAAKWGPRGAGHTVLNRHLSCSPCTRFGSTPKCPQGVRCLQEITADEVAAAAVQLLHLSNEGKKS